MIAIRNLELDVSATFPTQSSLGLFPKLFNNLDAVYLPRQLCENCNLLTKTGADLEDVLSAPISSNQPIGRPSTSSLTGRRGCHELRVANTTATCPNKISAILLPGFSNPG